MAGIKITYRGNNSNQDWAYVCEECREHFTITHRVSEDMHHRHCEKCGGLLLRFINKVPALDADYHESCKTHNIGWSLEGQDPNDR